MIYDGYRREEFTFRRVTWPGFREAEDYRMFTGGSLSLSALSELRAQGSLDFAGDSLPDEHDLVRVYYNFTDEKGESGQFALGTFFLSVGDPTLNGSEISGSVDLESVLRVAQKGMYGRYYTVKSGTNAVAKAVEIVESLGLKTNKPASSYTLAKDVVYEPDQCWMDIVNDLLGMAGYASAWPDAYGTVQMAPYVEPTERDPSWLFDDGARSIMLPEVVVTDNTDDTVNAVRLVYQDEEESLWASAVNNDPNSEASIACKGYEVTYQETINELAGDTQAERLENLKAKARQMIMDKSAGVEHVKWKHPWLPLIPNDAVGIDYLIASLNWRGAIVSQEIEIGDHCEVESDARRFVRSGFEITEDGGSW